jgi:methylenetetrahydrofolate reductase (NADPH)
MTITYGALGSTRDKTLDLAVRILKQYGKPVAHHLTCVGSTQSDIDSTLRLICENGIQNVVALRGDPPKGEAEFRVADGGFRYASELVTHIRQTTGLSIGVAGYPEKHIEAPSLDEDIANLRRKTEAGADIIFTQLFYDNSKYFAFARRCREAGIQQPIVPGLMPIMSLEQINRIVGLCGASIPPALMERLRDAQKTGDVQAVGTRHAIAQAVDLIEAGVPGIHFYVLNQSVQITDIMRGLRAEFPHL